MALRVGQANCEGFDGTIHFPKILYRASEHQRSEARDHGEGVQSLLNEPQHPVLNFFLLPYPSSIVHPIKFHYPCSWPLSNEWEPLSIYTVDVIKGVLICMLLDKAQKLKPLYLNPLPCCYSADEE